MYVITGATGNIGKAITLELLAKGKKVKAIGRNLEKLKVLTDKGAEPLVGDVYDSAFLKQAFAGAEAAFCMIPPNMLSSDFRADQKKVADNYINAVKSNNVKNVLLLSSVGAHLRKGAGVVDGLGYLEEIFLELKNMNVLNLRPGYFFENLYGQIGTINQFGIIGSAIKADLNIPMVATKDIAAVAAKRLLDLNFAGNSIEYVLGSRDLSYNDIARVIGKAIDKPDLKYVQFSYEDAKNGMEQSGFVSANLAELFNELSEGFNNGKALNAHTRKSQNTSPTSIEEFSQGFAYVYNKSHAMA